MATLSIELALFLLGLIYGANTAKPNILFMVIDDLGWTDISCHGAEYETKNICGLIQNGIELTNYYVHPVCSPTRSAIMTGQYSFKNGLQSMTTIWPSTTEHVPFKNPMLPEFTRKYGYTNHMLGKWHLGYAAWNMTPTGRGFESHRGYFQGAEDYYIHNISGIDSAGQYENGYDFWNNQQADLTANNTYSIDLYYNSFQNILVNYNKTARDQPLFLYMAFQTVHSPIEQPPRTYAECNNISNIHRQTYCNKIVDLDNTINDMINLYKEYKLWDDTLLIITTDNGGMPFWSDTITVTSRSFGCNMPYRAGKATLFEGGVKGVGFINGGKNVIPSNIRGTGTNILAHAIDWLPTIIEGVLNETLPENVPFDGRNMMPSIINMNQKSWNRTTLYIDIEADGAFAGLVDGEYKYFQGPQLYTGYFPCDQSAVYENTSETVKEWLFNIYTDPFETNNLAATNTDLVVKYQKMIADYVKNGGYMPEQDATQHPQGQASNNNGIWAPWLK
eukprot:29607_1